MSERERSPELRVLTQHKLEVQEFSRRQSENAAVLLIFGGLKIKDSPVAAANAITTQNALQCVRLATHLHTFISKGFFHFSSGHVVGRRWRRQQAETLKTSTVLF